MKEVRIIFLVQKRKMCKSTRITFIISNVHLIQCLGFLHPILHKQNQCNSIISFDSTELLLKNDMEEVLSLAEILDDCCSIHGFFVSSQEESESHLKNLRNLNREPFTVLIQDDSEEDIINNCKNRINEHDVIMRNNCFSSEKKKRSDAFISTIMRKHEICKILSIQEQGINNIKTSEMSEFYWDCLISCVMDGKSI